jgi:hypothetical protein
MGVEFTQQTQKQTQQVEAFIQALMNSGDVIPELQVQPEGLDSSEPQKDAEASAQARLDPLLDLFRAKANLSPEEFQVELQKQRGAHTEATSAVSA